MKKSWSRLCLLGKFHLKLTSFCLCHFSDLWQTDLLIRVNKSRIEAPQVNLIRAPALARTPTFKSPEARAWIVLTRSLVASLPIVTSSAEISSEWPTWQKPLIYSPIYPITQGFIQGRLRTQEVMRSRQTLRYRWINEREEAWNVTKLDAKHFKREKSISENFYGM